VEVVFDDGANVLVRRGDLFVQVRCGPMTLESIELLTALWRSMRRPEMRSIGALFVLEPGAPVPTAEVRARQTELFREMARDGRLRGALVIEGSGVEVTLKRSVARVLFIGRQVAIVSGVDEGVAALVRVLGAGVRAEALALLEAARERLHRSR